MAGVPERRHGVPDGSRILQPFDAYPVPDDAVALDARHEDPLELLCQLVTQGRGASRIAKCAHLHAAASDVRRVPRVHDGVWSRWRDGA